MVFTKSRITPNTIKASIGEKSIPIPPSRAVGNNFRNNPKNGSVTSCMKPVIVRSAGLSGIGIQDIMIRAKSKKIYKLNAKSTSSIICNNYYNLIYMQFDVILSYFYCR